MKLKSILVSALIAGGIVVGHGAGVSSRPNILLILADDLGFSDVGCYGGEIATPNLDALARNGLRFTQFYNTARCWPTRAAIITGYYPQQVRMDPPQGQAPEWVRTLPQLLQPFGYRSYHAGKWHVPGVPRTCADAGFAHSYRLEDHDRNFHPQNLLEDDQKLPPVAAGSGFYTATAFADKLIGYLQEHAERHAPQPFFAYLAFTTPHFPLQAPPADIAKYRERYLAGWDAVRTARHRRQKQLHIVGGDLSAAEPHLRAPSGKPGVETNLGPGELAFAVPWASLTETQKQFQATKMAIHAAMVDRLDQEVGRVCAQLKAMGAFDNTIILFLSDNGASAELLIRGDGHDPAAPPGSADSYLCLGPGWSTASNTPFRRHKIWVHEGGISTPLIVHWPKGIAARGKLCREVGHVIDLLPTLLDVADAHSSPAVGAPPFPGRSLVPAFVPGGTVRRDALFWHHQGNRALRVGDWKIVSARDNADIWNLHHLGRDRAELRDLATRHPERVREMTGRWQAMEEAFRRQATPPEPARSGKQRAP